MITNNDRYAKAQDSYHDFQGLRDLKRGAQADDPEALREVARQFEALFVQMIMKSARQADELIGGEDSLFNSNEMQHYQKMLDEQFSLAISQGGGGKGLGLAEALVSQLSQQPGSTPVASSLSGAQVMQLLEARRLNTRAQPPLVAAEGRQTTQRSRQPLEIQGLPTRTAKEVVFNSPEDFVQHLYPLAERAAKRLGLDPRVMLAQSALETGWGRHLIKREDGSNSFNLFGIKADRRWQGEAAEVMTLEYRNGSPRQERWPFRAYNSFEESMQDYVDFLTANPRYQQALQKTASPQAFAQGLQQAGYATDPKYANKIVNIMESPRLNQALEQLQAAERPATE